MGKMWLGTSNGCWVDVWDAARCKGRHLRVVGPVDLPYLRLADPGWAEQVHSLVVGPNAYVQCYEDLNFYDSVFWLLPNQRVDDMADLPCGEDIDSVRLYDRPPFAHEPGYAAYMLWAASHLARPRTPGGGTPPPVGPPELP